MSHRHTAEVLLLAIAQINAQMQARVLNPTPLYLWPRRDFKEPEPPPNILYDTAKINARFRYMFLRETTMEAEP